MSKQALLLINLGTPDDTSPMSVRRYLDEFLMDPWVIDIPYLARLFLVKGIILNTRPKKSAHAYEKIWTDRGSPLLFHTQDLTKKVQRLIPQRVEFAMRYGSPSIASVLQKLSEEGVEELRVLPLYPQYSLAANESSIQKVKSEAKNYAFTKINFIEDFFSQSDFIQAWEAVARPQIAETDFDHYLFSFHGIPERHVKKTDPSGKHCLASKSCCDAVTEVNRKCYRAQCFATARAMALALKIPEYRFSISFQSRLGRTPWIQPYTDFELPRLLANGKKRVAVFCPAFVADCLETLEEIGIRAQEDFIKGGGESLKLITSLNSHDEWARAIPKIAGY